MRVSDLTRQKPVSTTVDLGDGDTVTLTFDRNRVTPAWVQLAQKRDEDQDALSLPKALADVLLGWDVTDDDGAVFPPVADNIAVLSYPAQRDLLARIMEAAVPSDAEGKASPATSPAVSATSTVTETASLNGPATSPLPVPSASPSQT